MKRVAYIIENPNFLGGAHVATAALISELIRRGHSIDILSLARFPPADETRQRFGNPTFHYFTLPMRNLAWFCRGISKKLMRGQVYPDWTIDPSGKVRRLLKGYDTVVVMSELSMLRRLVSNLPDRIRKVQMIHTAYVPSRTLSPLLKWTTKYDRWAFRKMTQIAVVGESNAEDFRKTYPELAAKTIGFKNVIKRGSGLPSDSPKGDPQILRIVTVARFEETFKATSRTVRIAERICSEFPNVEWTFIGGGSKREGREESRVNHPLKFLGEVKDASRLLPEFDLLTLFSHVEGLPMVIYEALLSSVPVAATAVGGIRDQIQDGVTGWLFSDDEEAILTGLRELLRHPERIALAKEALIGYEYDNEAVVREHEALLELK